MSKNQKVDKHVEAEKDDDQEEEEMKMHIEIVKDDEVAIDAIPLATKPPVIVEYKIVKEGKIGHFQLIRADRSSKRPEEDYERVLWGDLKVMFEPDIKSKDGNESHNPNLQAILANDVVSCSTLSDQGYVEDFYDQ
ncbi:hypothetical protein Tco_0743610 [Tanacetum coccineum]